MKNRLKSLLTLFFWVAIMQSGTLLAKEDPVYTSFFNNNAVGGYDVTSYFSASQAIKGKKSFKARFKNANWFFTSQENLDKFIKDPERYTPQYGGYCAWAVAQGDTASGDPLLWTIEQGKLYLNYNKKINKRWLADKAKFIIEADNHWPSVLQ